VLFARLFVPPSDGRSVIVYCVCDAANKPQPIAINKMANVILRGRIDVFMNTILDAAFRD